MARPTNEEAADKRWEQMMVELKSNIPSLTKESLSELRKIVRGGKDIAVSNQLRAMENVFKIMQWMKAEEAKVAENSINQEDTKDEGEQVQESASLIDFGNFKK